MSEAKGSPDPCSCPECHWRRQFERLRSAVSAVYYAAHWTPDRSVDAGTLWTEVRDAAGFDPGHSPKPAASVGKESP